MHHRLVWDWSIKGEGFWKTHFTSFGPQEAFHFRDCTTIEALMRHRKALTEFEEELGLEHWVYRFIRLDV